MLAPGTRVPSLLVNRALELVRNAIVVHVYHGRHFQVIPAGELFLLGIYNKI